MNAPALLALIGLVWIGGFAALRLATARAVARESNTDTLSVLLGTGWLRGRSRRARTFKMATFAWLIGGAATFVVVGLMLGRRG